MGFLCQVGLCVLASPLPPCCTFPLLPRWVDDTDDSTGHSASAGLLIFFKQRGELIELAFTSSCKTRVTGVQTCREGGVPLGSCAPWYVVRAQRCCVCDPKPGLEQLACWVMLLSVNLQGLFLLIRKKTYFFCIFDSGPISCTKPCVTG